MHSRQTLSPQQVELLARIDHCTNNLDPRVHLDDLMALGGRQLVRFDDDGELRLTDKGRGVLERGSGDTLN